MGAVRYRLPCLGTWARKGRLANRGKNRKKRDGRILIGQRRKTQRTRMGQRRQKQRTSPFQHLSTRANPCTKSLTRARPPRQIQQSHLGQRRKKLRTIMG